MEPITGEWYKGKSVFVTGGTGFVGKVLLEKLLRSCEGIPRVYLLCRPRRGSSANARISEMTHSVVSLKSVYFGPLL
jgi:fatty acyl-CoA reductase